MARSIKGRGAAIQPANPYLPVHVEADLEHVADDDEYLAQLGRPPTEYLPDESQSIVAENDSPDVGFRYSVNPYRGCSHGCSYCYARPDHEYLGMSAGLDFETKVLVKHRAAELLREFLGQAKLEARNDRVLRRHRLLPTGRARVPHHARLRRSGRRVPPADRHHHEERARLPRHRFASRAWPHTAPCACRSRSRRSTPNSPASWSRSTSSPDARLRAIRELSHAGIPTNVMTAPIIPGLNDSEIPAILTAAREAGAIWAGYVLLKLPTTVRPVFLDWLERNYPDKSERVRIAHSLRPRRPPQRFPIRPPPSRHRQHRRAHRRHVSPLVHEARLHRRPSAAQRRRFLPARSHDRPAAAVLGAFYRFPRDVAIVFPNLMSF